jgi:proteasome accessory factor C
MKVFTLLFAPSIVKNMLNQNRILKVLQLIGQLKAQSPKSLKLLAKQFETSERTIYRYIDLLNELGFEIKKDAFNRYFISGKETKDQFIFSNEEADFLKQLVLQYGNDHLLKEVVLRKIGLESEMHEVGEELTKVHLGKIIENLNKAIENKVQVVLKNYFSVHSNSVSDRWVEPVRFSENYQYLCAFEIESLQNKFYAIERIQSVKLTHEYFKYEKNHFFEEVDVFGFSKSDKSYEVDILFNLRAFILFKEEYPNSLKFITETKKNEQYRFCAEINNLKPLARFVKGLPGDIIVQGKDEFIQFLKEY